jgi:hypothetical protein
MATTNSIDIFGNIKGAVFPTPNIGIAEKMAVLSFVADVTSLKAINQLFFHSNGTRSKVSLIGTQ